MNTITKTGNSAAQCRLQRLLAWFVVAALLVGSVLLNACGGGNSGNPPANTAPVPPSQISLQYTGPETISSLSPDSATAGSKDLPITVTGQNFDADGQFIRSRVFWSSNGRITQLTPLAGYTNDTNTQLHGLIPAALMIEPGVARIYVAHYDPMGDVPVPSENFNLHQGLPFTVTAAPAAALALGHSSAFARQGVGADAMAPNYKTIDVPGSTDTRPFGANNLGQIVGRYDDADGVTRGFLRRGNGSYYTFSAPQAVNGTWGQDISDDGVIVGRYYDADFNSHGFVLDHGQFRKVEYPGAIETTVRGISGAERLTGNYIDSAGFETGFLRDRYGFHSILYPNSDSTDVWDTAPDATMVGDWSDVAGNIYGYSLRSGQFRNLNVPGAATVTSIRGINTGHTMVGVFDDATGALHGFVRSTAGQYIQLDVPGGQDTVANRINDRGAVIGFYAATDGSHHGFVVTGWERGQRLTAE
jgi:hypothetical protein